MLAVVVIVAVVLFGIGVVVAGGGEGWERTISMIPFTTISDVLIFVTGAKIGAAATTFSAAVPTSIAPVAAITTDTPIHIDPEYHGR